MKICGLSFLVFASVALAKPSPSPPLPSDLPYPKDVKIEGISYLGDGCRQGSVAQFLASDAQAFTLLFDSYIAQSGPDIAAAQSHKQCRVVVKLSVPSGWSYTVADAVFRGYVHLDKQAKAEQKTNLYFQGKGPTLKTEFAGPYGDNYQIVDSVGDRDRDWSPCKKNLPLIIDTQAIVHSKDPDQALMTVDSIDGEITQTYHLSWKRCKE